MCRIQLDKNLFCGREVVILHTSDSRCAVEWSCGGEAVNIFDILRAPCIVEFRFTHLYVHVPVAWTYFGAGLYQASVWSN